MKLAFCAPVLFSFLAFLNLAQASNYDGLISRLNSKIYLRVKNSEKKLVVTPQNAEIETQINKLKTSDFISLEGKLAPDGLSLLASSVNYVGLNDLIGNWVGNDEFCYAFRNFSSISIFSKTSDERCLFTKAHWARDFSYTINPSTAGWLVFLSDDIDTYLLDLSLKSKTAELSLYDSKSGDILKEIKLKR